MVQKMLTSLSPWKQKRFIKIPSAKDPAKINLENLEKRLYVVEPENESTTSKAEDDVNDINNKKVKDFFVASLKLEQ